MRPYSSIRPILAIPFLPILTPKKAAGTVALPGKVPFGARAAGWPFGVNAFGLRRQSEAATALLDRGGAGKFRWRLALAKAGSRGACLRIQDTLARAGPNVGDDVRSL